MPQGIPEQKLTDEQTRAIELFLLREPLKIEALAGTGKTSTLIEMAKAQPTLRGHYLAFNQSMAVEATTLLGNLCACTTTHGLAFNSLVNEYGFHQEKLSRPPNSLYLESQLAREFYELPVEAKQDGELKTSRRNMARLIHRTLSRFSQSSDPLLLAAHLPSKLSSFPLNERDRIALFAAYGPMMSNIWEQMADPANPFPLGHDGYLKIWALKSPRIAGDYILLDEVQDTSDVVLDVLAHQSAPVTYVGDSHQQIYEWRGAVNALTKVSCTNKCTLTNSFRFGNSIASLASGIIHRLGSLLSLRGFRGSDQVTNDHVETDAILCRYNKTVITETQNALRLNRKVHVIGGIDEFLAMDEQLDRLEQTGISDHADLFGFHSLNELRSFCKMYPDSAGWPGTILKLRESGNLNQVLKGTVADEQEANVTISTIHRAKGKEWNRVRLNSDLQLSQWDAEKPEQGRRLQYVAITRAKQKLSLPKLLQDNISH